MPRSRQTRLTDSDLIRSRIKEFVGKKINIVLKDNRVIVGEVMRAESTGVTILNMRLKPMRFSFQEITEIYFDTLD